MAHYETGAFTSPTNLLNLLATFLTGSAGWTQDALANQGLGRRGHFTKGSLHVNLRAYENEIRYTTSDNGTSGTDNTLSPTQTGYTDYALCMNMSTGSYSGGSGWEVQSGAPVTASPAIYTGKRMSVEMRGGGANLAGTYHFVWQASPEMVWVFIEHATGSFQFLSFGLLSKDGTYTGGEYFSGSLCAGQANAQYLTGQRQAFIASCGATGSTHNTFVRVGSVDSFSGWLGYNSLSADACLTGREVEGSIGRLNGPSTGIPTIVSYYQNATSKGGPIYFSKSQVSSQQTLLPIAAWMRRTDGVDRTYYSLLGVAPHAFYCRMDNYDNAQAITVGSATYRVFSFKSKADAIQDGDGIAVQVS